MPITLQDAIDKSREVHFDADGRGQTKAPGSHPADDLVDKHLRAALRDDAKASRSGRALVSEAEGLWDADAANEVADSINQIPDINEPQEATDKVLQEAGLGDFQDQFTAERFRNRRTEVLTREVDDIIAYGTPIVDNFFDTQRRDAGTQMAGLQEFVRYVESFNQMGYHSIDRDRGEIPSFTPGFTQESERINPQMQMYGVKAKYEDRIFRVLDNMNTAEILAMFSVAWAQASSEARERDASRFLTDFLSPTTVMSTVDGANAPLGQPSGLAINGEYNGTLDVEEDVPKIIDYMQNHAGMSLQDLRMLLPHNAWPFLNMRKGYRRFLGEDGSPIYESPQLAEEAPEAALNSDERYGLSNGNVGYSGPQAASNYLMRQRERQGEAAQAAERMAPGPMPFLPRKIPNWMQQFRLPNTAFGPMTAVLTPFAQAQQTHYAEGHPLRNDDRTNDARVITTTDALIFDGTRPMHFIESVPPTSWDATNEEHGKKMMVMVEGYALANRARGQQAIKLEGLVLENNYKPTLRLQADKLDITDYPMAGDSGTGIQG